MEDHNKHDLSLPDALAIIHTYSGTHIKSRLLRHILHSAERVVGEAAKEVATRIQDGVCTDCWGDGWGQRGGPAVVGTCQTCGGTGLAPNHPKEKTNE